MGSLYIKTHVRIGSFFWWSIKSSGQSRSKSQSKSRSKPGFVALPHFLLYFFFFCHIFLFFYRIYGNVMAHETRRSKDNQNYTYVSQTISLTVVEYACTLPTYSSFISRSVSYQFISLSFSDSFP